MKLRIKAAGLVLATLTAVAEAETANKLTVVLIVEAQDQDLRDTIRSALAAELRQLGDIVVADLDSSTSGAALVVNAVSVGTVGRYAMWVEANATPLIMLVNRYYPSSMKDPNGCVNAEALAGYFERMNKLLAASTGSVYRGGGRDALRNHCGNAVAAADNSVFKLVRQFQGTEK